MELNSANRIAIQLTNKIMPACLVIKTAGDLRAEKPKIKKIEMEITPSNRKLLDALLLECSTPISTSNKKLVRLYQNVQVVLYLV